MLAAGVLLFLVDYLRSLEEFGGVIERNAYGQGDKIEVIEAVIRGSTEKVPIEVSVAEQRYKEAEIQELFQEITRKMEEMILGDNQSLDRVEYDMNLLTEVPGEPIGISWELDRYDVMDVRGELQEEALREEGTYVTLSAVLTYQEDEKEQARYQCVACVFPRTLSQEEQNQYKIEEEIQKEEEKSRTQRTWELPGEIDGNEVSYYRRMNNRGLVLMLMALLIAALLYALEKQNQKKEQEAKQRQMLLDYPEIVSKVALFLGAGMTLKRAFRQVAEDYERQKESRGVRYAYEEMKRTCREMDSKVSEAESYENFGRRCNMQVYIRFGALLSQNLRKGTKGLTSLMKWESIQAFEERKARAKRQGEEAGTKLLLPMFLMLSIVLIIVVVPAFLSMQI